jgi:hypothetical protein
MINPALLCTWSELALNTRVNSDEPMCSLARVLGDGVEQLLAERAELLAQVETWKRAETDSVARLQKMYAANKQIIGERDRALALLREVEWSSDGIGGESSCPICGAHEGTPHTPGCRLAAALGAP